MSLDIVFMGTPDFAVESLKSLMEEGHNILAAVVQPDKPKGRGMKLEFPPVKKYALDNKIGVLQPQSVKKEEFLNTLKDLNPDVIVVTAYGKILPKAVLDLPKYGCINVHASLLPKYRGAAPIQWPIINGDKITGVTTMYMDEGLDTGDIILKQEVNIDDDDTFETLHNKLAKTGGQLLVKTLGQIEKNQINRIKQDENQATYTQMLKKEDGLIDWNRSAKEIRNLVRGLNPWPGAYTYVNNIMFKIWKVEIEENESKTEAGMLIQADNKRGMVVSAGIGEIRIIEIQPEGKKRMRTEEYLLGHKLSAGQKFTIGRD